VFLGDRQFSRQMHLAEEELLNFFGFEQPAEQQLTSEVFCLPLLALSNC
jgi:hypothetical protein